MPKKKTTDSALSIFHQRIYAGKPQRQADLAQTRREVALGHKIRNLRQAAGLSQKQLADEIGTQPSAVSRIEDADYDRHSISLLERVANALDMRLIIDFEPTHSSPKTRKSKIN